MGGVFHISEADAARDFGAVLQRVRAGEEAVVEAEGAPVVTMKAAPASGHAPRMKGKTANEIIESLSRWEAEHGMLTFDAGFADDVAAAHERLNRPLDSSSGIDPGHEHTRASGAPRVDSPTSCQRMVWTAYHHRTGYFSHLAD